MIVLSPHAGCSAPVAALEAQPPAGSKTAITRRPVDQFRQYLQMHHGPSRVPKIKKSSNIMNKQIKHMTLPNLFFFVFCKPDKHIL